MSKSILLILCVLLMSGISGCQSIDRFSPQPTPTASNPSTPIPPIIMPSPTPIAHNTPTIERCRESSGSIREEEIPTKLLSRPVSVKLYLPPCYDSNAQEDYPVLYMLHGQAETNDEWIKLGLTITADQLITDQQIQPMIIVMPYEITWRLGPEESAFGETLIKDVIPYLEGKYRFCTARDCRAIGGLSRGGNWAVYLGFSQTEVFTAVGAHSAPLFYGEIGRIQRKLDELSDKIEFPALYIDAGKKDEQISQILEFVNFLKDAGIDYEFHQNEGRHEEAYWSAHTTDYLLWYSSQLEIPK